jgi:hypothetical protein
MHLQVTRSTWIEMGLRPRCVAACKRGTRNSCAAPSVRPSLARSASGRVQGLVRVLRALQQACFARRTAETAFWHWRRSILRHWRRAISSQSGPCSPIVYLTYGDAVRDRTRRSSYRLPKPPAADSKSPTRLTDGSYGLVSPAPRTPGRRSRSARASFASTSALPPVSTLRKFNPGRSAPGRDPLPARKGVHSV